MGHMIYSKQYPDMTTEDYKAKILAGNKALAESKASFPPFPEFLKKLEEITYEPIPQKMALKQVFINRAIEVADDYELDLEIIEDEEGLRAYFSFDKGPYINHLKEVILFADSLSVITGINNRAITIVVDFDTHQRCKKQ